MVKIKCWIETAGAYTDHDTLEGFTVDAELLGQYVGEAPGYDNHFYDYVNKTTTTFSISKGNIL